MGKALPRRIGRHTHPAARPEDPLPPKASGIDYLGLVAARVATEQAQRIGYAAMADDDDADIATGDDEGPVARQRRPSVREAPESAGVWSTINDAVLRVQPCHR